MAGASDKARFYLEQSVPELQEFASKKIFTKEEIGSINQKRSDFEHKLNARGSRPSDYARYAEYEMNLESLRKKRVKRLGIKQSNYTGQRRISFVLDRATKKFPGDIGLWMQYITFARKQKSNKRVSQILTSLLRLHPTRAELWVHAANYAMEERGDMMEARSYMQRGLRFSKRDERLWVEYARLEMIYIAKIVGRRRILGLDQEEREKSADATDAIDGDLIALPTITTEEINPDQLPTEGLDQEALEKFNASPALSGAIPMAIFDAAVKHFKEDQKITLQFFDMVAKFQDLPCTEKILAHIMDIWHVLAPECPETLIRWVQQPVRGSAVSSAGFPTNLIVSLDRINSSLQKLGSSLSTQQSARPRGILGLKITEWLLSYIGEDGLDPDIRKVIVMTLRKVWSQCQSDIEIVPSARCREVAGLISKLRAQGLDRIQT